MRCGTRFPEGTGPSCPECGLVVTEESTLSEMREWSVTRRRGRWRFVWVECVLTFGVPLAVMSAVTTALVRKSTYPLDYVFAVTTWPLMALLTGLARWRGSEREYAAWLANRGRRAIGQRAGG